MSKIKYKLVCGKNPKKEGIELKDGSWDWDKFRQHIKTCEVCRGFTNILIQELRQEMESGRPQNNTPNN